jgi:hypothetical protein
VLVWKRTCTFVPVAMHTLQHMHRACNARARAFLTEERVRGAGGWALECAARGCRRNVAAHHTALDKQRRFNKLSAHAAAVLGSARPTGHGENVECRIQLLFGQTAVGDVAVLDNDLTDGLALLECLLGHGGSVLITDVAVQRRHDRR